MPRVVKQSEFAEQKALIKWRDQMVVSRLVPELEWLIWIPGGLPFGPRVNRFIKEMGNKDTLPDLHLFYPKNGYHGLFIELKKIGGMATAGQLETLTKLRGLGYDSRLAHGRDEAKAVILNYLGRTELI